MANVSIHTVKNIVNDLQNIHVCDYCVLRFLNEKNPAAYLNVKETIAKISGESIGDSDVVSNQPCSACLGLIENYEDGKIFSQIVESVKTSGFDAEEVTFALSLPIVYILRNYSIWLYISNKYFSFYLNRNSSYCQLLGELRQDNNVVSVKEAWKWMFAEKIGKLVGKTVNDGVNGCFHVNINISYAEDAEETKCLIAMHPDVFKNRGAQKRKFHGEVLTRKSVESSLMETDLETLKEHYPVPPNKPMCGATISSVDCCHDSIYLAGRYNKYCRALSQTPWLIQGERRMEDSVEEHIIRPVETALPNSGVRFSSSGREDVDVRTLGTGRPFFLDIVNPRKTKLDFQMLRSIENQINTSTPDVFVRDLQVVNKDQLSFIKLGEQSKTKTYTALCVIKLQGEAYEVDVLKQGLQNLDKIKDIQVQQKTPIRVLHRRPLAVRPRKVFWLQTEFSSLETTAHQFVFKLKLKVEAGTYIKEFVHGDFNRTKPSVSELLGHETDIIALDVEEVALDWPPSINYSTNQTS